VFGSLSRVIDPHVEQYLLTEEDEQIVDEVRKHPMAIFFPVLRLVLAVLLVLLGLLVDPRLAWVLLILSAGLGLQALWRILEEHMDRFVITNMRAFRVHGILAQQRATTPMSRILDITVDQPFIGRIFGYGHFVFESAAQDQGLRDIRFVGEPNQRDVIIQTVIQRAGLRARMQPQQEDGV
jgi:membrane protein YdbS with pleckstrin-like domain